MRDFQRTERNGAYCEVRDAVSLVSSLLSSSGVRSVSSSGVRSVRWTHLRQKCPVRCFRCRRVREIRVFGRKRCRVGTYTNLEARFSANASAGRCAVRSCRSIRQCRRSLCRPPMSEHSSVPQVDVPLACVEAFVQFRRLMCRPSVSKHTCSATWPIYRPWRSVCAVPLAESLLCHFS